ncbi:MAG: bacterioferritin [Acidobacteria bacterium]|nr:bacterioferritin [Acidobacteriota bacterium]
MDQKKVIDLLNRILEAELAGAVRYTHYSFMVFGYNRIPIVSWMRSQAAEGMAHANKAGELITHLGAHPSLGIGSLLETHQHDMRQILLEALEMEHKTLALYQDLLKEVQDHSVLLEEYAREAIVQESMHIGEVDKMLRKPGDITISPEAQDLQ